MIDTAVAELNPDNALSAIVRTRVRLADSIAARFRLRESASSAYDLSAVVHASEAWTEIPVLGLLPEREYELRVVAYADGHETLGLPLEVTTEALPAGLPTFVAGGADASSGYVAMASGLYGVVIDNAGRVVWYHRFPNGPWLNFMAQANGRYTARLVTPDQNDIESWVEIDPLGRTTRTLPCHRGLQPRFHDLLIEPDGSYWILCDENRDMDLTSHGGSAHARVTGQALQHVGASGELLFDWSVFDHFDITDVDPEFRTGPTVNWTHANSLAIDGEGNILVSFRNLNEITSIDRRTGAVLWRLGGRRNQFALADGSELFAGQHSVRSLASGEILLLDNIGSATESRGERWSVNATTRIARMTGSFGSLPGVRTLIGGSVQSVSADRTLVSFGTEGRVEEYDAQGTVRWRIEGTPGYVFRAQRFPSLYRPGVGAGR